MQRRALRSASPRSRTGVPAPCALAVGGLDPSGGAGILADDRGFRAASVWGCAVISTITVQSTAGLVRAQAVPAPLVLAQAREVLRRQSIRAVKTGALGSAANVRALVVLSRENARLPLVVDPVMIATRSTGGARLLDHQALEAMRHLVRRATLVTPNVAEAEALLRGTIRDIADAREAAERLVADGAGAALVKGGHLEGDDAADVLCTQNGVLILRARRQTSSPFHGGGCTLAALITGRLAHAGRHDDRTLIAAIRWAKRRLSLALTRAHRIGPGLLVLSPVRT
jgi:hydroxymethylpyrimidine/phosphomethylpyrimidine kinase